MQRVAILSCEGKRITTDDLPIAVAGDREEQQAGDVGPFAEAKDAVIQRFERTYLADMLQLHGGNVHAAARAAGMDRANFKRLLRRHGLGPKKHSAD